MKKRLVFRRMIVFRALMVAIVVCLFLVGTARANWSEQDKLLASDGDIGDYFGTSVSISGDYVIVGARNDEPNGTDSGSAYIFTPNDVNPNNWDQVAKLTASDGTADDQFGYAVSIDGNHALVGAWGDDPCGSSSGSAYIFKRDGSNWIEQAKLIPSDGAASDYFSRGAIGISGDYAIVGAYNADVNGVSRAGSAYIFYRNQGGTDNWGQQAKLTASDGSDSDMFGVGTSVSGDYCIVGAFGDEPNGYKSGSAYVFKRSGINWTEQDKLTASDGDADDWFGEWVSIDGDYAIIGADNDEDAGSDSGSAYIFKRDTGLETWTEQTKLLASDPDTLEYFGNSVSISGDYAVVGKHMDDPNGVSDAGSAYVFKRDGTSWIEKQKLTASDGETGEYFGGSVSIDGDYVIAGAVFDNDNGINSGSAYTFRRECPTADLTGDCCVNFVDLAVLVGQWLQGCE